MNWLQKTWKRILRGGPVCHFEPLQARKARLMSPKCGEAAAFGARLEQLLQLAVEQLEVLQPLMHIQVLRHLPGLDI